MADFNININAEVIDEYIVNPNTIFTADTCDAPISIEHPIGLLQDTVTSTPTYYMLNSYTDATAWKTLKIKNVVYSHPSNVYLSDTLVKIPEAGATVYDFDITGQAVDIAIPDLTVTLNSYTPTSNATITFDLAIQNTDDDIGSYTSVTILISKITCSTPTPRELTITPVVNDGCSIETDVTVNPPEEGSRYVVVTASDIYGSSSDTTAGETITVATDYSLILDVSTTGIPSITSTVLLRVYSNSMMTALIDSHQISRTHEGNVC